MASSLGGTRLGVEEWMIFMSFKIDYEVHLVTVSAIFIALLVSASWISSSMLSCFVILPQLEIWMSKASEPLCSRGMENGRYDRMSSQRVLLKGIIAYSVEACHYSLRRGYSCALSTTITD